MKPCNSWQTLCSEEFVLSLFLSLPAATGAGLQPSWLPLGGGSHSGVALLAPRVGTFHFGEHQERLWARVIHVRATEGVATALLQPVVSWKPSKPHAAAAEKKSKQLMLRHRWLWASHTTLGELCCKEKGHVLRKAASKRVVLVYSVGLGAWRSAGLPAGSGPSLPVVFLAYKCAPLLVQICLLWQRAALLANNVTAILTWSSSLQTEERLMIAQ